MIDMEKRFDKKFNYCLTCEERLSGYWEKNVKEGGEDLCCVECNSPNWDNLKQFIQEEIKRAVIEYDTNVISTHIQMSSKKKHIPLIENILESRKEALKKYGIQEV